MTMTDDKPVTVVKYYSEPEAAMAVNYLQERGVKCWLDGEAPTEHVMVTWYGYAVQVSPDDAERARRLLEPIIRRRWRWSLATTRLPTPLWIRRTMTTCFVILAILLLVGIVVLLR
jgi:hypothetical protein